MNNHPPSGPGEAADTLRGLGFNVLTFDEETGFCPMRDYPNEPMGKLGNVTHYRCRACGCTFSGRDWEPEA